MRNSDSNPKNTGKSQYVAKEGDVPPLPCFEDLKLDNSRDSSLIRQGFDAILEYEKKKNRLKLTSQEKSLLIEQLQRREKETDYHVENVMAYITKTRPEVSNTDIESSISVQQVEASLVWLEEINPNIGELLRREVFLKHKDRFDRDMRQVEENKTFSEERSETQVSQEQYRLVTEQSPLTFASRGLKVSQYLLSGFLVLYVIKRIYELVYKSKNKKKD